MEKEGKSTKFCLICNYVSRIIQPLTSRCAKFRFKPLANDILVGRLKMIADKENVQVSSEAFQSILDTSEGDLRRAITTLQSAAKLRADTGSEKGMPIFRIYAQRNEPRKKFQTPLYPSCAQ